MAEQPLDHGVQIRFISDLREPRRPPRPSRARGGSYGVAVRVQGIAGQPFVVLNSGDNGGDSFGVQIKGGQPETPPNPPKTRAPGGSEEEGGGEGEFWDGGMRGAPGFAEREGSWGSRGLPKFLDEEGSGGSREVPKSWDEELRKVPKSSEQEIPGGSRGVPKSSWDEETSGRSRGIPKFSDEDPGRSRDAPKSSDQQPKIPKSSEELRRSQSHGDLSAPFPKSGAKLGKKDAELPKIPGDVDTEPLRSVDSLITKFDGNLPRGRAARRFRGPGAAPRKRSQSLDTRNSRESAAIPPQIPQIPGGFAGVEEQSVEMQVFGEKFLKKWGVYMKIGGFPKKNCFFSIIFKGFFPLSLGGFPMKLGFFLQNWDFFPIKLANCFLENCGFPRHSHVFSYKIRGFFPL